MRDREQTYEQDAAVLVIESTANLARSITWKSSKQTFITGCLIVDRDLVDDFFRAYAYFRWIDDVIDVSSQLDEERIAFIRRQRDLLDRLYNGERIDALTPNEEILADLISHDRGKNSGLQSFIRNMFTIIEFDAYRKGWLIGCEELRKPLRRCPLQRVVWRRTQLSRNRA